MNTHDLKLIAIADFKFSDSNSSYSATNEYLKIVAESYANNLERLHSSMVFPEGLITNAILNQFGADIASVEIFGRILDENDAANLSFEDVKKWTERVAEIRDNKAASWAKFSRSKTNEVIVGSLHQYSENSVVRRGIEAHMSSLLISSWTCFENMATDLWIAAVNNNSMTLGISAIESSSLRSMSGVGESGQPITLPKLSFDIIKEYRFNLEGRIGEMLWDKQGFNFNSLSGLYTAYKGAFSISSKNGVRSSFPNECEQWFKGNDHDQLGVLQAIRNVLVHRAGRVDKPFIEKVKKHVLLSKLSENQHIQIDGEMVSNFAVAAFNCGQKLLKGVDQWLTKTK